MLRQIFAVLTGFAVWTVLWLAGNAGLRAANPGAFNEAGATSETALLAVTLLMSVGFSLLAGFITATMSSQNEMKPVAALAVIQVVIGILVEISYWNAIPVWYHITFILLLAPAIIAGGRLAMGRKMRTALV